MPFLRQTISLMAAASLLVAPPALAQSQTPPQPAPAPPPCTDEVFRHFDFWVGEWAVFTTNDQKAGDNSIQVEENGCLLVERWTSATGGTGQSYNYVELGTGKWRQVWVSAGATIDYDGGLNDKGEMALEGTIAYPPGNTAPFKGIWTPLENGDVRQHFEQYDAETDAWKPWFTGLYKRKAVTPKE